MPRKYFYKFTKISFLVFSLLFIFNISLATTTPTVSSGLPNFSDIGGVITGFNKNIIQSLITLLSGVALVLFLWGLVRFIFDRSKGDEKNLQKDKESMMWGLGALFVLVSVWGIIKMAQSILGISSDNTINLPKICIDGNCAVSSGTGSSNGISSNGGQYNDTNKKIQVATTVDGSYTNESVSTWNLPLKQSAIENKEVAELQNILNKYSGSNLTIDGKFGSATFAAVKAFQSANKLISDGQVGPSTRAVILYRYMGVTPPFNQNAQSWPELSLGSQGTAVVELQTILKQKGCYNIGANSTSDGKFGQDTKEALDNYQKANFLLEDSIVGPSTRSVLEAWDTNDC